MSYTFNLAMFFDQVVAGAPAATAIKLRDAGHVTFAELDALSNRVGHWLKQQGVRKGDVVAIFHDKSDMAYASMLACLKLGVIYTNLDADSPWERLRKIVTTCHPKLVLNFVSDLQHSDSLADMQTPVVQMHLRKFRDNINVLPASLPVSHAEVTGNCPAYIMFTSGSTGMPKGAVMSHANLLNFIQWARETFHIGPGDTLSNANPMYFDNSVFDFYAALFTGATLLPVTATEVRDPRSLIKIINEASCTVWFSVPSLLVYLLTTRALKPSDFPTVRKIIFGGEGFPKPKLKALFDLFGHRIDLENVYGPTECTCICSSHRISEGDFEDMQSLATLGYLAPNFDYEILPQNAGDPEFGELFLTGPQVGLGYFNDPERTLNSFRQNPNHTNFRDIGYRTGDLVKRDAEGRLHFRGRSDFQIKHMGYRIELEEIEAALSTVPGVKECGVVYRRIGDGMGQIVGFAAVAEDFDQQVDLVSAVAAIVPPYMVPKRIEVLTSLPKNANGKIDRVQLQQQAG